MNTFLNIIPDYQSKPKLHYSTQPIYTLVQFKPMEGNLKLAVQCNSANNWQQPNLVWLKVKALISVFIVLPNATAIK